MRVVNHAGITVTDLDRSVRFYRDVVGLELEVDRLRTGGEWFDTLTGRSGAVIDVAMLGDGDFSLQLVQYVEGGDSASATGHERVGNVHLSINVGDVEAKHAQIVGTGAWEPTPIVQLPAAAARSFYVRDPDGIPVEFIQLPRPVEGSA